jgi:organic radical activating enzyme
LPNLVLTFDCNNSCEFCFAETDQNREFRFGQIDKMHHFIKSFNRESVNIVGGEPTMNKDFLKIVTFLLGQSQKIMVFTNGNISNNLVEELKFLSHNNLQFCVNRSQPEKTTEVIDFYREVGYMIMLGVTIYKQNQIPDHVFEEINTYKLNKTYRLGIALPSWPHKNNRFISPGNYEEISGEVMGFIKQGLNYGIIPSFDCGFPYCVKTRNYCMYSTFLMKEHSLLNTQER